MYRILFLFCFIINISAIAQQNEEFAKIKKYYDYQRYRINKEMKAKFEKEPNVFEKTKIQQSFYDVMNKIDSIENKTYISALIITKNKEDLGKDFPEIKKEPKIENTPKNSSQLSRTKHTKEIQQDANYPGGINLLRKEIANYFYLKGIRQGLKKASTNVYFIVEKDGRISHVKAKGEDNGFNTQAEIAVYRLRKKFTPAYINNQPVRYRFTIPISMHFE